MPGSSAKKSPTMKSSFPSADRIVRNVSEEASADHFIADCVQRDAKTEKGEKRKKKKRRHVDKDKHRNRRRGGSQSEASSVARFSKLPLTSVGRCSKCCRIFTETTANNERAKEEKGGWRRGGGGGARERERARESERERERSKQSMGDKRRRLRRRRRGLVIGGMVTLGPGPRLSVIAQRRG